MISWNFRLLLACVSEPPVLGVHEPLVQIQFLLTDLAKKLESLHCDVATEKKKKKINKNWLCAILSVPLFYLVQVDLNTYRVQ
jgi:hypothetical protein